MSDGAQVREVISRVRRQFGPIAGVVHGAGLQSPALVSRKRLDRALGVVRTKVNGAYHLWHAVKDDDPKFFVLFGSTLGRSGMDGQTDYTAAADVLPKIAAQLSGERPHTRSFTLAWTAWAGTGMAADESVRRVQEEQRGLRYIGIREGVQTFARELLQGCASIPPGKYNWGRENFKRAFQRGLRISVFPSPFFNTEWQADARHEPFKRTLRSAEMYDGAFAWHWHNRWDEPIEAGSKFQLLEADIERRLAERGIRLG